MDAKSLIDYLKAKNVRLIKNEDKLNWKAPKGAFTDDDKVKLKQHKSEILKLIEENKPIETPDELWGIRLIQSDCLKMIKSMPENTVDLIVTDPPYGLKFMGKDWDKAIPSVEIWKECFRVLKPGALAFIMCPPRQDLLSKMISNIQDAGFKTDFTSLYWTYATGFPKAHNIGKVIDKKLNGLNTQDYAVFAKEMPPINKFDESGRYVIDYTKGVAVPPEEKKNGTGGISRGAVNVKQVPAWIPKYGREEVGERKQHDIRDNGYGTKKTEFIDKILGDPVTPEAKKLEGSYAGFQPKPAVEVILVVMKPLIEKGYTDQALANGKGITWLDDCRIPYADEVPNVGGRANHCRGDGYEFKPLGDNTAPNTQGRFPANLLVSDDVLDDGNLSGTYSRFFSLDAWAGKNTPFLIVPKPSQAEKEFGLDDILGQQVDMTKKDSNASDSDNPKNSGGKERKNYHPTVKPIQLMSYLITMGSREGDIVLDPFCGSGTTCLSARLLKRGSIGIDKNPEYYEMAKMRLRSLTLASYFQDDSEEKSRKEQFQDECPGTN